MATKSDLQFEKGIRLSGGFSLRTRLLLLIIGVTSTLVIVLLSLGNPHMKSLFWPGLEDDQSALLEPVIAATDKAHFLKFIQELNGPMESTISAAFDCVANDSSQRHVVFYFSKIDRTETQESQIVLLAQDVTQTRKLTDQLQHQANHDELTGLKNRRAFDKMLKQRLTSGAGIKTDAHLLLMDLDQFKIVNDTCGHCRGRSSVD